MEIITTKEDGKAILAVSGKLSASTAAEFEAGIDEAIGECRNIVLDFADVTFLASAGIRVLIAAAKKLKKSGDSLVLKNIQKPIEEVLEMTGLAGAFTIE
jgi:anti-sigma B factor antagonist